MVESGGEPAPSWTSGVDGHGTVLAFSWLPWPLDEIKSRRDGPRTGNRHFILKKVKFYSRSRKKVTVLNLFYKGAVSAYFLTGPFFKKRPARYTFALFPSLIHRLLLIIQFNWRMEERSKLEL